MPSFSCACGHRVSLHVIPNPNEGRLIWDTDAEHLDDAREALRKDAIRARETGDYRELYKVLYRAGHEPTTPPTLDELLWRADRAVDRASRLVVRCDECGRLYVQCRHGENEYDAFVPEIRSRS
jgi:hypothetical protein